MIKEAVVETIQQVEEAIANGANRIELCDNLAVGGTTPSYGMTEIAAEICHINHVELAVMIFNTVSAICNSFFNLLNRFYYSFFNHFSYPVKIS